MIQQRHELQFNNSEIYLLVMSLMTVRSGNNNSNYGLKELPNVWSCKSDTDHKDPLVALSWCEILLTGVYNIQRRYFIRKDS